MSRGLWPLSYYSLRDEKARMSEKEQLGWPGSGCRKGGGTIAAKLSGAGYLATHVGNVAKGLV
jgi:hypothetical protein